MSSQTSAGPLGLHGHQHLAADAYVEVLRISDICSTVSLLKMDEIYKGSIKATVKIMHTLPFPHSVSYTEIALQNKGCIILDNWV